MKRKTNRPLEAARQDAIAAAEDLVNVATGKVAPIVQSAADRLGPLVDKTTHAAQQAASRVGPYAQTAVGKVNPYAQTALGRVSPYAQTAVDRVGSYSQTAVDRVSPYAQSAVEYIVPVATAAGQRSAQVASEAVDRLGPAIEEALGKVGPAVEAARVRVTVDLLPKLTEALGAAAASPVVLEATRRGRATVAAARGDLALPDQALQELVGPDATTSRPWVRRLAVLAVVAGVAGVAVRKFLGSQGSGWQSARPTAPYVPPAPTAPPAADSEPEGTTVEETQLGETFGDLESPEVTALQDQPVDDRPLEETVTDPGVVVDLDGDPEVAQTAGTEVPVELATDDAAADETGFVGEGAYVGDQPPEGYTIKGNSRSRKYHLPDSPEWTQTTAEVWFNSEDAAQAAGFVRAHG